MLINETTLLVSTIVLVITITFAQTPLQARPALARHFGASPCIVSMSYLHCLRTVLDWSYA